MIESPSAGHLLLDGADVTEADAAPAQAAHASSVQMVFQNPYASLNPRKKIGHVRWKNRSRSTPALDGRRSAANAPPR